MTFESSHIAAKLLKMQDRHNLSMKKFNKNSVIIRDLDEFTNNLGKLLFCNDLLLIKYKRLYFIRHSDTNAVRAWQGHPLEGKCFLPVQGKFLVCWVKIDDFNNPSKELIAESIILDSSSRKIIEIPKGYANGLKALEPNSEILVLSELELQDSLKEKIRYDPNLWYNWGNDV